MRWQRQQSPRRIQAGQMWREPQALSPTRRQRRRTHTLQLQSKQGPQSLQCKKVLPAVPSASMTKLHRTHRRRLDRAAITCGLYRQLISSLQTPRMPCRYSHRLKLPLRQLRSRRHSSQARQCTSQKAPERVQMQVHIKAKTQRTRSTLPPTTSGDQRRHQAKTQMARSITPGPNL